MLSIRVSIVSSIRCGFEGIPLPDRPWACMRNTARKGKSIGGRHPGRRVWGENLEDHFVDIIFVVARDTPKVNGHFAAFAHRPVHFHVENRAVVSRDYRSRKGLGPEHMGHVKTLAV